MALKRYLIDGIGVASWLFWEFFPVRWKILFSCGGEHARWTQGENAHLGWKWSCEVTFQEVVKGTPSVMHMMWEWSHEVDVRWKWSHEVTFQGVVEGTPSDMHARWEWSCKVDMRWKWSHEVTFQGIMEGNHLICMWGGNGHVRLSMRDENAHVRWEWSREVRVT